MLIRSLAHEEDALLDEFSSASNSAGVQGGCKVRPVHKPRGRRAISRGVDAFWLNDQASCQPQRLE